jgi:putative DNA primase/helicase
MATSSGISVAEQESNRDHIITVVRSKKPLGKQFVRNPDGTVSKQSVVKMGLCKAVMHYVPTPEAFKVLLEQVANDPHAAIINASFDGIAIAEPFVIGTARAIQRYTGIPVSDRARQKGVHLIEINGKTYKVIGRFKENVRPSSWQLLDRDIDRHTPVQFAKMSTSEWLRAVCSLIPGVTDITYCHAPSTSARVLLDGVPVGGGNGHVWIQVRDPADVERFRTAITISAVENGMSWRKPRYSRTEPDKVVGYSLTTPIDTSVMTPGRLVFVGKPVVGPGLTVAPLLVTIHLSDSTQLLDTAKLLLPAPEHIRQVTRKAGVEMAVQSSATGLCVTSNDLTLDTELETRDRGVTTVRALLELGKSVKIRCQTPFRDSSSFSAFYSTNPDGKPFVFDSGTSTTHWLDDSEARTVALISATGQVSRMLARANTDCGAPFEPDSIGALTIIHKQDPPQYRRIRAELKKAKDVSVPGIEQAMKAQAVANQAAQTHHGYAVDTIARLTVDGFGPIAYEGTLYVVDADSGLWTQYSADALARLVAQTHDGNDNCVRKSDYSGIAQHIVSLASDESFFRDPPIGLACPGGFFQVKGNDIEVVPLTPHHRQRVMLSITPCEMDIPLFMGFLHETFQSTDSQDEAEQLMLVQEMNGATMLGIAYRYQKAFLFYEPFGRAGKGVLTTITSELVPKEFVKAVSPFVWDREYYIATLARARLNVVGEMPDGEPIPAAAFKTVLGGDMLTGRHPTHRPVSFRSEAAHVFCSNHFPYTKDHGEAFYARWKIVSFPNSRLVSGLPQDPGLAERIIAQELPGIAHWALEGAMRVLRNGGYSSSVVHDRLMAQWRRSTNSLEEFIAEACTVGDKEYSIVRSAFYRHYAAWCEETGRKPFAKGRVKDLLEHNIGLGITWARIDGIELFRGVQMRTDLDVFKAD